MPNHYWCMQPRTYLRACKGNRVGFAVRVVGQVCHTLFLSLASSSSQARAVSRSRRCLMKMRSSGRLPASVVMICGSDHNLSIPMPQQMLRHQGHDMITCSHAALLRLRTFDVIMCFSRRLQEHVQLWIRLGVSWSQT